MTDTHTDAQAAAPDEAIEAALDAYRAAHPDGWMGLLPVERTRVAAAVRAADPIIRRQAEAERDEARAEVVQAIRSERDEARAIARAFGETLDREKDRLILRRQQVKNLAGRLADAEAQRDRLQQIMDEAYSLAAVEVVDLRTRLADAERERDHWKALADEQSDPCPLDHRCDPEEICGCWCSLHDCRLEECVTYRTVRKWLADAERDALNRAADAIAAMPHDSYAFEAEQLVRERAKAAGAAQAEPGEKATP